MESPAAPQLHAKFILPITDDATQRGDTVSSATHEASAAAPIKDIEGPANGRKALSSILLSPLALSLISGKRLLVARQRRHGGNSLRLEELTGVEGCQSQILSQFKKIESWENY